MAAVLFPGIAIAVFILVSIIAWWKASTDQVPFTTLMTLITLWLFASTPLLFLGAHFGYKAEPLAKVPDGFSASPPIPDQPRWMSLPCVFLAGGALPYRAIRVELVYMLGSGWVDEYYGTPGMLLLSFVFMLLTAIGVTMLFVYLQLHHENYHWWWRSFVISAGTAGRVFYRCCIYHGRFHTAAWDIIVLYIGYMGVFCVGLACMMGFVGVTSSLCLNHALVSFEKTKHQTMMKVIK
jgi:transmembrane 9 superfamily protein 2/4